jgi:methylated-DNA-[protein]-cysteine S-methyltransferase
MKSVYKELLKIPYGKTASYKEIAEKIDCPKGYRAVGQANNKNPIAIIVPCHRVIGFSGNPTGYAGGVNLKIKLLELEKAFTAIG